MSNEQVSPEKKRPEDDPVDMHDCDHAWVYSNFTAPECLWCGVKKAAAERSNT